MSERADATVLTVGVERLPLSILAAHLCRELSAWCAVINTVGFGRNAFACNVVFGHSLGKCHSVYSLHVAVNESATVQLVQYSENTTSTVALLYTILLGVWRELAQARHVTAQAVDVSHCKFGLSLLSDSEQVEHGVGAATHGNIKSHGIEESVASGYAARKYALVAVLIVGEGVLHNLTGCSLEEFDTVLVSCEDSAVARQSHTDGFGKRVHRVGCEHTRAASASRTRALLNLLQFVIRNCLVGTLNHSCDKVGILAVPSSSLHRSARTEHGRDVKAHRRHQHTRSNLVAIGNANHSISLVCVDHVFY